MANDVFGMSLNIDGSLFKQFEKMQEALDTMAASADKTGGAFANMFKQINTSGIDAYLQKLYDTKVAMEAITQMNPRRNQQLQQVKADAKNALDTVNNLIDALSKTYGVQAPTSTTAQQKAEESRYNEWLRQKHEEEQIHKQIEDRKTQATRSAIAEQNQAYADANAKKQSIARDNDNVKTNSEVARKTYEEQLRMYENLFAQADKKRPDLIDVAKTRTDINAIDSQLDKLMDRINRLNNEMQLFKSMESGKTLKTEDYAHIGKVSDELNKLMAQYEALDKLKIAMSSKSGFEQAIADLSGFSLQAQRSKQALDDLAQSYRTGTSAFHQQMKTPEFALDFSKNAKSIEEERQAIQLLKQARESLDRTTPDGKKKVQELTDAIANHEKNLKRATQSTQEYNEAQRKLATKRLEHIYSVSPNLALNYSQQAKSINEQILAIKRLKSARDNLNRGSFASEEEYRKKIEQINNEIKRQQTEVDKLTNKNKNLSNSHRSLMDTAGQLQRKLALLFSVSAISGYFNKLVSVRGEFELQAKSLEVLLQNKDEANRLWNQTVQLAVKSPFTVKELVTYTKQLAAYRIESEKLFETNKMLADVSAGLGVDMNRLILAFGQVKAANFLRGTELRQFSEAGVNMLEELAKRFTVLEGRAVSVGDVFERVSKRMVSFADVEAVFKTITSEGGAFYQMQEKQAETLRGMVTNLKDQIALMLNDIGMSNEGMLKGLVSLTVTLVKNWRDIVPLIDMVAGILITRLLQKGMVGILRMTKGVVPLLKQWRNALRGATVEATAMGTALGKVTKANAWLALIGIVASLGYAIYDVVTSASKLEEELGRIDTDLTQRLEESISGYINLAKSATDASKSMTEQREALSKLNSAYSDILPQYMLTHDYLKQLQGDYTDVTDAIRLYYETQAIEQKKAKIKDNYSEDINTNTVDLIRAIKNQIKDSDLEQYLKDYLLASVSGSVHATLRDVEQGKIASDTKAINEAIFGAIAQGSGLSRDALIKALKGVAVRNLEGSVLLYNWSSGYIGKNIYELSTSFRDLNRELEGLEGLPDLENKIPLAEKADFEKAKANFDTLNQISNEWINIAQRIANGETTVIESFDELNKADLSQFSTEVSLAMTAFKQSLIDSANEGTVAFSETLPTLKTNFLDTINTIIQSSYKGNTAIEELGERISKLGDKDKLGEVAQDVYNAMKKIAEIQNIDIDVFKKVIPEATSSLDSYKKIVESRLETLKGVLKSYTESSQSLLRSTFAFRILQDAGFSDVEQIKKEIEALDLLFKGLGGSTKDTGKGSRNILAERIKLIRDAQKAYQDLNKDFNADDANKKVIKSYADAFKEIGLNIKDIDFTNVDGVVDALSELEQRGKLTNKQMADLKKAIAEVQLEKDRPEEQAKTKALIKDIQKMFDQYDLSLELDKMNISPDIAKNLFGIETTKLSEIRNKIEQEIANTTATERLEELQKLLDKVNEMESKAQVERLKTYSKYLTKAMDERVKIKLEELRQIQEIEELEDVDTSTKKAMKKGVSEETEKKISKQDWADFKGSEVYIEMFRDLDKVSDSAISAMISRLEGLKNSLKDNLDPSDLKEIVSAIDKMQDELEERKNPFTSLISNAKEYFDFLREKPEIEKKFQESIAKESELDKQVQAQKDAVAQAKSELEIAQKADVLDRHKIGDLKLILEQEEERLNTLYAELLAQQKITKKQYDQLVAGETAGKNLKKNLSDIGGYFNEFGSGITSIATSLESVFGGMSDSMRDTIESISEISNGIGNTLSGIGRAIANPADIGGYIQALSGLASTIGSIFSIGDKKKERQIQREIKLVEQLENAYKDLERAIESAYSVETLKSGYDESIANINKRITSTYKMIDAERDKKDTDQGRIDEWLEQIKEFEREKKELQEEIVTGLGGSYDIRNTTREFVEAWIEAFNETGNGLHGLEENFKEFFKNILIEQAIMKGASTLMEPLLKEINASLADDYKVSTVEMENILSTSNVVFDRVNEYLSEMFGEGSPFTDWISDSADNLTGLQRGIQGITESQADIIAAYLNSMRAYVADNNLKLTQMLDAWTNTEVENPMVAQLKIIATQTTAIHDLLGGLTKGGHSEGGKGLKVFIS